MLIFSPRARIIVAVVVGAIVTAVSVRGQTPASSSDETARAIRELTTEVRALRAALEKTSGSQLQGSILGMYLNVQQARVSQAANRVDSVRRELDGLTMRSRELAQQAANVEAQLPQTTDAEERKQLEMQQRALKQESEQLVPMEQQARGRETEAYQWQQTEEQRWTELVARLEQLLKKQ